MTDNSTLFRPITLGSLTLPNRIVMAPMTRNMSPANAPGDDVVEYYRRRAAGVLARRLTRQLFDSGP